MTQDTSPPKQKAQRDDQRNASDPPRMSKALHHRRRSQRKRYSRDAAAGYTKDGFCTDRKETPSPLCSNAEAWRSWVTQKATEPCINSHCAIARTRGGSDFALNPMRGGPRRCSSSREFTISRYWWSDPYLCIVSIAPAASEQGPGGPWYASRSHCRIAAGLRQPSFALTFDSPFAPPSPLRRLDGCISWGNCGGGDR
jgi:hypothetical protein